jgi:glycosyltransferase involved in cell wall biosynthesis
MNILQLISSARTSGAEKHLVILSERLRQRGHNVVAVCPPGGWLTGQLQAANIPSREMPMHGPRSSRTVLELRKLIREEQIDVIHSHLTRATYMGYLAGKMARTPMVSTVHVWSRDFAYRWLPGRHCFVSVSDYLRDTLISRGVPERRVHTVYNGTPFGEEDRVPPAHTLSVRAELGLPADAELIGLFGRVDAFKGHPILVRAARSIVEQSPRAYFVFVGHADPGIQQGLWELATQDGVDGRLRFTGVRDDIPRLMDAMDVVTLPSRNEACSMAIIEAMAMGKPVVATRTGGNPELVDDHHTGLLVERTPEALAGAISSLLNDASTRDRMGQAGRTRARSLFSAQTMVTNIESLYRQVVQDGLPVRS